MSCYIYIPAILLYTSFYFESNNAKSLRESPLDLHDGEDVFSKIVKHTTGIYSALPPRAGYHSEFKGSTKPRGYKSHHSENFTEITSFFEEFDKVEGFYTLD